MCKAVTELYLIYSNKCTRIVKKWKMKRKKKKNLTLNKLHFLKFIFKIFYYCKITHLRSNSNKFFKNGFMKISNIWNFWKMFPRLKWKYYQIKQHEKLKHYNSNLKILQQEYKKRGNKDFYKILESK